MTQIKNLFIALCLLILAPLSLAKDLTVEVFSTDSGKSLGTINMEDTQFGILFTPDLKGLEPGVHGFHVHTNPSCDKKGKAAGTHYDPMETEVHGGPYYLKGHSGDLPVLIVNKDGDAKLPILAPRLAVHDLNKHSLVIHEKGDDYQDSFRHDGGGGKRVACTVIGKKL